MTQNNVVKTREAMIQKELWNQENPSSTPSDMLQSWPTNDWESEEMAQFKWVLSGIISGWPKSMQEVLEPKIAQLSEHYHSIDARSKQLAVEAAKGTTPSVGTMTDTVKKGIFPWQK